MICYKDKAFCPYWHDCQKGGECHRAMTDEVVRGSARAKLPISQFAEKPDCWEKSDD